MKRFVIRRFLVKDWLWKIAFVIIAVSLTLIFVAIDILSNMQFWIILILAATMSVFFTYIILRVLWFLFVRINGGPFKIGDTVQILSGPYRNKITMVYEVWKERSEVRLNLNDKAKNKYEDVFSFSAQHLFLVIS